MTETSSEALDIVRPLLRARQVREFTDRPPTTAQLHAITEVARWSGSSRNEQPWRFLVITHRPTLTALHDAGLPQTRALRTATAAVAITLPDDPTREISDAYDDGRAAERMLIAATWVGLGAGIAWIRADVLAEARRILAISSDRMVRTIMALGEPTEAARRPRSAPGQARKPRAEMVRKTDLGS
jgi:nitroreductase